MRWHLVDTDKTYLQLKNLKETPTDNRDMGQNVGKHMFCNTCWNQSRQLANMFDIKYINNYFKSSHCGKITVYLDRIH